MDKISERHFREIINAMRAEIRRLQKEVDELKHFIFYT